MTLDKNDYLTHQLYTASKTPRVRNSRTRNWIFTTITFLGLTYILYDNGNLFLSIYFLVFSILSALFYPLYSRWRYKRHYLKYIQDTYRNRFGEECKIEITEDHILTQDKTGNSTINTSEIEQINEIKDFYFIKMKSGVSIIISKAKSDDLTSIEKAIESLVNKGIKHNIELDWKWK